MPSQPGFVLQGSYSHRKLYVTICTNSAPAAARLRRRTCVSDALPVSSDSLGSWNLRPEEDEKSQLTHAVPAVFTASRRSWGSVVCSFLDLFLFFRLAPELVLHQKILGPRVLTVTFLQFDFCSSTSAEACVRSLQFLLWSVSPSAAHFLKATSASAPFCLRRHTQSSPVLVLVLVLVLLQSRFSPGLDSGLQDESQQTPVHLRGQRLEPGQTRRLPPKKEPAGLDRVVLQHRFTGDRFMNLTQNDLDKFPKTYSPLISKLVADIRKQKSPKLRFGFGFGQSKQHQPVETEAEDGGWGKDEFDSDFDDYEEPENNEDGEFEEDQSDYEDPSDDPAPDRTQIPVHAPDPDSDQDYEPPPSEPDDFSHKLPCVSLADGDYIDNHVTSRGPPPALSPRPPVSAPHRTGPPDSRRDASPRPKPPGNSASGASRASDLAQALVLPPTPASVNRSNSGARAPPHRFETRRESQPVPDEDPKRNTFPLHSKSSRPGLPPVRHTDSLPPGLPSAPHKPFSGGPPAPERPSFRSPPPVSNQVQDLDPRWYVGKVTRAEAEATLQRLGKDGAYVVRDSSRQSAVQPYTLMVLYQNKVFNIQIQIQDQKYLLGTGLKVQESFASVRAMVEHFSQSPLLLIDSKNRGTGQQNQCVLCAPAGPYMDRI
ncbi:hypothetical protein WMY93_007929 [Mugilogobius chulae]|uniref:SH2 domain-containing protein n=1 Tax=Mugilogobius chulae TaxID=88201 RepID=A0AAW0PT21_9GOBI